MYSECNCDCCGPQKAYTSEEKLEILKEFKEGLKEKMEWVDEAITELKKPEKKKTAKK